MLLTKRYRRAVTAAFAAHGEGVKMAEVLRRYVWVRDNNEAMLSNGHRSDFEDAISDCLVDAALFVRDAISSRQAATLEKFNAMAADFHTFCVEQGVEWDKMVFRLENNVPGFDGAALRALDQAASPAP